MTGPLTAEQWNHLLATDQGEDIVELLRPFYIELPTLNDPTDRLNELTVRFVEAGLPDAQPLLLRVGRVSSAFDELRAVMPEELFDFAEYSFSQELRSRIGSELRYEIAPHTTGLYRPVTDPNYGAGQIAGQLVWATLVGSPWDTFGSCFHEKGQDAFSDSGYTVGPWGPILLDSVRSTFHFLLELAVAIKARPGSDHTKVLELVTYLLDLYHAGNFPVGRLKDSSHGKNLLVLAR